MTNKTKVFFLIIGLVVCLLIVLITKTEAREDKTGTTHKNHRVVLMQSVVNTGTQWIIQNTYTFLKTN